MEFRPYWKKASLNSIIWLLGDVDISSFSLKVDYSSSLVGRKSGGNTGVWLARSQEIQELLFTHCSVNQTDLEDLDCGISPRGFRKEPHWNLDKLESCLRNALTSYGKSAKFPLVSLDSVGNLVISCWPPPTAASFPPASSHPSINPVQPWISAQCSRGLDSPRRAEFPGSRTSCVPRGDISTEGRFGPVAESKALISSNCVGTWGGSVRRQTVSHAG